MALRHCVVVRRLTPPLRRIGCAVSRRRRAPILDESIVQGVPGSEPAMHRCSVGDAKKCEIRAVTGRRIRVVGRFWRD